MLLLKNILSQTERIFLLSIHFCRISGLPLPANKKPEQNGSEMLNLHAVCSGFE